MSKVRVALLIAGPLLLSACGGEANVYDLRPDEAYRKLRDAKVATEGNAIFGRLETEVSGDGAGTVYWRPADSGGTRTCEANIVPEGETKSRITAYCGSTMPGDAASGMLYKMNRQALIEHIDAALTDRPFDYKRAQGSTAANWPKDPRQADGSYGKAVGEAVKMQKETERMIQEMEAQQQN